MPEEGRVDFDPGGNLIRSRSLKTQQKQLLASSASPAVVRNGRRGLRIARAKDAKKMLDIGRIFHKPMTYQGILLVTHLPKRRIRLHVLIWGGRPNPPWPSRLERQETPPGAHSPRSLRSPGGHGVDAVCTLACTAAMQGLEDQQEIMRTAYHLVEHPYCTLILDLNGY